MSQEIELAGLKHQLALELHKKEMSEAATKLSQNPSFKKLILSEYIEKEPVRLTHLLGQPHTMIKDEDILETLKGISQFRSWIRMVESSVDLARIQELQDAIEGIVSGEDIE